MMGGETTRVLWDNERCVRARLRFKSFDMLQAPRNRWLVWERVTRATFQPTPPGLTNSLGPASAWTCAVVGYIASMSLSKSAQLPLSQANHHPCNNVLFPDKQSSPAPTLICSTSSNYKVQLFTLMVWNIGQNNIEISNSSTRQQHISVICQYWARKALTTTTYFVITSIRSYVSLRLIFKSSCEIDGLSLSIADHFSCVSIQVTQSRSA